MASCQHERRSVFTDWNRALSAQMSQFRCVEHVRLIEHAREMMALLGGAEDSEAIFPDSQDGTRQLLLLDEEHEPENRLANVAGGAAKQSADTSGGVN